MTQAITQDIPMTTTTDPQMKYTNTTINSDSSEAVGWLTVHHTKLWIEVLSSKAYYPMPTIYHMQCKDNTESIIQIVYNNWCQFWSEDYIYCTQSVVIIMDHLLRSLCCCCTPGAHAPSEGVYHTLQLQPILVP